MTLKLKKSQVDALPFDFEQAVRDFIAAKEAHRFTGDAAPSADALVEAAVRRVQYPIEDKSRTTSSPTMRSRTTPRRRRRWRSASRR
jgi:hypothetical protein